MRTQRKSPLLLDGVTGLLAAAQQDLPKADVQITQIGRDPIRTFAALLFYVSHADNPACRYPNASGWYLRFATVAIVAWSKDGHCFLTL